METTLPQICDPTHYCLEEAIEAALEFAVRRPALDLQLVQLMHVECLSARMSLPTVLRGLEVLGGLFEEHSDKTRLITLLRPFLRSSDPRIASKCLLVLGRQSRNMTWLRSVMKETDERIRANLIESLWRRKEHEVEAVMQRALRDVHPRVAANAVYGLYAMDSPLWPGALQNLIGDERIAFRKSGIWMIRNSDAGPSKLQPLIRDSSAEIRKAAFAALKDLRERRESYSSSTNALSPDS